MPYKSPSNSPKSTPSTSPSTTASTEASNLVESIKIFSRDEPINDPSNPKHYPGQVLKVQYDQETGTIGSVSKLPRLNVESKKIKGTNFASHTSHSSGGSWLQLARNSGALAESHVEKVEARRAEVREARRTKGVGSV